MKLPHQVWSSFATSVWNTNIMRHRFLEYFINEHHYEYMKSVPVAPRFDHASDFIHSGAYQFSRVFTGEEPYNFEKCSGLQKCVKMDPGDAFSELFNHDPYKLSFFEMASFWSKGGDFRRESCRLSWDLLTTVLKLDPETLNVSYFSGDGKLGLPIDEETREIWLELGVPAGRILSGDKRNNWWKLRAFGPCGPCTKIYVTIPGSPNMLELWNVGFINVDDVLKVLPNEFISAGLGLERLTSVLQRTYSCYHIDSFMLLYDTIQKISGAPEYNGKFDKLDLNAKYRQLADLIRTITVAVTDDIFPDTNVKMKRFLRKALYIARTDFKQDIPHLMLMELSARVAETLQEAYPEVGENLNKVQLTIENEENALQEVIASKQKWWETAKEGYPFLPSLSSVEVPETVEYFHHVVRLINTSPTNELSSTEISKVCNRFGIPRSAVDRMLKHFGRTVDWKETRAGKGNRTSKSVTTKGLGSVRKCIRSLGIVSDDTPKHNYSRNDNGYTFPDVRARLSVILDGETILSVDTEPDRLIGSLKELSRAEVCFNDREFGFVCDRTNFVSDRNDLCHDLGYIILDKRYKFKVNRVKKTGDFVIHYAFPHFSDENVKLRAGVEATLSIDAEHRLKLMRSHTLSHLLVIALREIFSVMCLKSSKVSYEYCRHNISVLGEEVDIDKFGELLELKVRDYIRRKLPICAKRFATSFEILRESNVLYVPNTIYPFQNIRLVAILDEDRSIIAQEPCDAVHVFNTGDVGDVIIPYVNYLKRKRFHVTGITETVITKALDVENTVRSEKTLLEDQFNIILNNAVNTDQLIHFSEKLYYSWYKMTRDLFFTPHLVTRSAYADMRKMKEMSIVLTAKLSTTPSEILVRALRSRIEKRAAVDKVAVYFCTLQIPFFEKLSFIVDILYRTSFPSLFLCYHRGRVTGVCHVPEHYVSNDFNAETWVNLTIQGFTNELEIKEEADNNVFCYLKGERVKHYSVINYVESLTAIGRIVAEEHFVRPLKNDETTSHRDRS